MFYRPLTWIFFFFFSPLSVGFHGNSSFCLGEEEEVEIELQEDFMSFDADLLAEQLTYMDAVSGGEMLRGRGVSSSSSAVY